MSGGAADRRSAAAEAMADGRLAEMNAAAKERREHKTGDVRSRRSQW
jgi:hypothetical protein